MSRKKNSKTRQDKDRQTARPSAAETLQVETRADEDRLKTLARVTLDPGIRHAQLAMAHASQMFGNRKEPSIMDSTEVFAEMLAKAEQGDKRLASRLLASQAVSLDTMFTEMARRSAANMGEYPDAHERYMRIALKAQSACRTTLDTLAKLHQPREQTVKHVHVNEGGQAVVADEFHAHTGGGRNEKSVKQSHATRSVGESASLPSPNPQGNGVPVPGGKRQETVSDARRDKSRGAVG